MLFSFYQNQSPSVVATLSTALNPYGLNEFYISRVPKDFVATEGYYGSSLLEDRKFRTTTSMLNTPYFTNAILYLQN